MKIFTKKMSLITKKEIDLINITEDVNNAVTESGIDNGIVFVISCHTTTGLTVNEGLPDLELDIKNMLKRLISDEGKYNHSSFLHSDGQMAINAPSHLRSALLGFEVFFSVENGIMQKGGRQTIYFTELDGPVNREYIIKIMGE